VICTAHRLLFGKWVGTVQSGACGAQRGERGVRVCAKKAAGKRPLGRNSSGWEELCTERGSSNLEHVF
jgi:hypothetical protein